MAAAIPECHISKTEIQPSIATKVIKIAVNDTSSEIDKDQAKTAYLAYTLVRQTDTETKTYTNIKKLVYQQPVQS